MIFFIVLNQYEALGFLLAAKSILRFSQTKDGDSVNGDAESEKSEYVLAGSFLSVLIALFLALLVLNVNSVSLAGLFCS